MSTTVKQLPEALLPLQAIPNWVCYRLEHKPGKDKASKPPVSPITGRGASSADPSTWSTYQEAVAFCQQHHLDGIGFQPGDSGIAGIDIDNCLDAQGNLSPFAQEVVNALDSYTEVSPSGKGLRIFAYCSSVCRVSAADNDRGLEVYRPGPDPQNPGKVLSGQYLTVTGRVYGKEKPIQERTAQILSLYRQYGSQPRGASQSGDFSRRENIPPRGRKLTRDEAMATIRSSWREILPTMTTEAKKTVNRETSWVCPVCGHGEHGDGLTLNPRSKDNGLKCFGAGCKFDSGSIVDLYQAVTHCGTYEAVTNLSALLGLDVESEYHKTASLSDFTDMDDTEPHTSNTTATMMNTQSELHNTTATTEAERALLLQAQHSLTQLPDIMHTGHHRGLPLALLQRFGVGYCKSYTGANRGAQGWECLLIPSADGSYTIRNLADTVAEDNQRYRKQGKLQFFNVAALTATAPVFIVEGELDALSIIHAGGNAVGLGSADRCRKFTQLLQEGTLPKPTAPLLLALDNDDPGRAASSMLESALRSMGLSCTPVSLYGAYKDANETLQANPQALAAAVSQAVLTAQEAALAAENQEREQYLQTSTSGYLQAFLDGIADSVNTPPIPTGFPQLDRLLDGGLYEGLYFLGAISSLGKTAFCLQVCDQIAAAGHDVLIFALEMSRSELMARSISRHTLLDTMQNRGDIKNCKTVRGITNGARHSQYSRAERELIQRAVLAYGEYAPHIYIHEGVGNIGVAEVRQAVEKHIRLTGRKPFVLIDYLQILAPANERASDKQNTDKAVLELKRLSRDHKLAVLGISSFNRDSYTDEVNLASFKESGAIEYGADVLIGLQFRGVKEKNFSAEAAKNQNPRQLQLKVLKNRNGSCGNVFMEYYQHFNYYKED